jgi:hypothetical protein
VTVEGELITAGDLHSLMDIVSPNNDESEEAESREILGRMGRYY